MADNRWSCRSLQLPGYSWAPGRLEVKLPELQTLGKTDLKRGSVCCVLGSCWMILLLWIRVPKAHCWSRYQGALCGFIPISIWLYPRPYPEVNLGASSQYLDDDDRWETVSRTEVCKTSNVFQTNSGEKVFNSSSCTMVCLDWWYGVYGQLVLLCTAAIAPWWSKMEPKRLCVIKLSINLRAPMTHERAEFSVRKFLAQLLLGS